MNNELDFLNISALNFNLEVSDKVDQICAPLFQYFGVVHFGYIRIFKDGTMLRIANNQVWTLNYFENSYYNDFDLYSMRDVAENESRLMLLTGEPKGAHCIQLCKEFKIWNALAVYEKFADYSDFWFFASSPNNTEVVNFYLNQTESLRKFSSYFKDKFSLELKNKDPGKLIISKLKYIDSIDEEKIKVKNFFNNLNIKSYQLGEDLLISKKEFECLFYLVQGKTMKEIARLMNISFRTAEFHLNNIKNKTDCRKKSHIIDLFLKNELFCSLLPSK